jgi:hypothetical protein
MGVYQSFSPQAFARSLATTLPDHITKIEEACYRNFQLLALIQNSGNVSYNNGGAGFTWNVQYRNHTVEANTGETPRNFSRKNLWKRAELEYRGYEATDAMLKREYLENRGKSAIIRVMDGFGDRLKKSIMQALGTELFIDGTTAANSQAWHGLESMFGATQTINISSGVARTANALDWVGAPNTTYAGLSTSLGNYGGDNEAGVYWPLGLADPEYDFWSPLIVNYTSSAFGGGADTWAAQGDEAMRFAIVHAQRNSTLDGQITNIMLDRQLYFGLLNLFDNKEQIQVTPENGLRALGFKNVLVFDGVEVSWEAGVPSNVGYALNYANCELRCMNDQLLELEGPDYDMRTQSFNVVAGTLSNLKYTSPRNFAKLVTLA